MTLSQSKSANVHQCVVFDMTGFSLANMVSLCACTLGDELMSSRIIRQ